jgi:hypothetical protein
VRAVLLVALAGCGRFGFGESDPSDAGGSGSDAIEDSSNPNATPQFCDQRVVTTLPIGPLDPVTIRAVWLGAGYAVAIETVATDVPLLELDSTASLVAVHGRFTTGYGPLYGISVHDDRPALHLMNASESYIKFVLPDWQDYASGPSGDPSMVDPAYAQIGPDLGIAGLITNGEFHVGQVDDATINSITDANYLPLNVATGSLVPIPGGARVAVGKNDGECETFVIDSANQMRDLHRFAPCYAPKVAALDDSSAVILHRTDDVGPYSVHVVPQIPTDIGFNYPLPGATYARVSKREDGAYWIGHGSGSHRALTRMTRNGATTESREETPSFYFDLTERDAFWYDGASTVHVSTPCLR